MAALSEDGYWLERYNESFASGSSAPRRAMR